LDSTSLAGDGASVNAVGISLGLLDYLISLPCPDSLLSMPPQGTTRVPMRAGNEEVARKKVHVGKITGHLPTMYNNVGFTIRNAEWYTSMCQYKDESGTVCGFVEVPDCIIECRSESMYATKQVKSSLFNPSFMLPGYRAPQHVVREWALEDGSMDHVTYCNISPKYPPTLLTKVDGALKEVSMKEAVSLASNSGHDLVINAILKCKVSRCTENGRFTYTTNCIIDKALMMGLAPKHTTMDKQSGIDISNEALTCAPEYDAMLSTVTEQEHDFSNLDNDEQAESTAAGATDAKSGTPGQCAHH
jgi:hypothetical protein